MNKTYGYKFLKKIDFKNLGKWYVSYYINPFSLKSKYNFVKLKNIIKPYKNLIRKEDYNGKIKIIEKITFKDGKIHLRKENKTGMNLYELKKNQLLVSKINFHQGALAINKESLLYCSTHYQPYDVNYLQVLEDFLILSLRSKLFQNNISYLRAEGIKNEATYDFIGNLEIPLPSIKEQQRIIEKYNSRIKLAEKQEKEVFDLENAIENFLFLKLNIPKDFQKTEAEKFSKIKFIDIKSLSRWGVEFLLNQKKDSNLLKSQNIPMKKLGTIVDIDPKSDFSILDKKLEMSFIPMHCVSDEYGEIINLEKGINEKSKGYTRFQDNDLIWAKITPCMQNGKSAILRGLKNGYGYGSTEFFVIRNSNPNVLLDYIYHILRTNLVRQNAVKFFTGSSGQQRVPKSYLQNLEIPLPNIKKQKYISDEIYKIKNNIKQLKKEAEQNKLLAQTEFEKELFL